MTIAELKKIINDVPDHFIFEIEVEKKVSESELEKRQYKYPIDFERCQIESNNYDIGWSDEKIKMNVRINNL